MITERELSTRLNQARKFAEEGQYPEALEDYLFFFDNSRGIGGFGGTRLSYVLAEIANIGAHYAPAREALALRRDEREALILAGSGTFEEMHELKSLNRRLNDQERNTVLINRLAEAGPQFAEERSTLIKLIWKQLVEAKRYTEVEGFIVEIAQSLAAQIAKAQVDLDFATEDDDSDEEREILSLYILPRGVLAYEALIALDKEVIAEKLRRWLLFCAPETEVNTLLTNAARKVEREHEYKSQ